MEIASNYVDLEKRRERFSAGADGSLSVNGYIRTNTPGAKGPQLPKMIDPVFNYNSQASLTSHSQSL
ncbi:hypothetical protein GUITHDRAFT_113380 [Guillardia theta CCMP2712]|uniref:Uncharacterized protein n=1 Tax=Guillardia theta (strain CCMP2712) TaxID=905079 RepID=L1IXH7_GUITC|nr:hypothetical protein GUITHDRAFT_113380 [Guillardia theta CCMP2712]EKX40594.1 hypothetical protein GUITHDRAFT_113380 [Guillardia theta CCMP2712]|eukprot:XP_005827574.1 hypothetical protein GUITHDRAFT_113380 [Guillardia theta CCMP2712]